MYQRRCTRYPVHFRSTLSIPEETGTAMGLSIRGSRVQSFIPVLVAIGMKLSIEVPKPMATIQVEQAVVRWGSDQEFGIEFASISREQFERLTKIIQQLPPVPDRGW